MAGPGTKTACDHRRSVTGGGGSRELGVGSGESGVGSRELGVGSGEWGVRSWRSAARRAERRRPGERRDPVSEFAAVPTSAAVPTLRQQEDKRPSREPRSSVRHSTPQTLGPGVRRGDATSFVRRALVGKSTGRGRAWAGAVARFIYFLASDRTVWGLTFVQTQPVPDAEAGPANAQKIPKGRHARRFAPWWSGPAMQTPATVAESARSVADRIHAPIAHRPRSSAPTVRCHRSRDGSVGASGRPSQAAPDRPTAAIAIRCVLLPATEARPWPSA